MRKILISAAIVAGLGAVAATEASAQYYGNPGYYIFMPNVIEIAPTIEPSDISGNIELYLTDKNNKHVKLAENKVIFKYHKSNRITADMNW